MEYLIDGKKYSVSYKELKKLYQEFIEMDDETFLNNLVRAAHLSCIIGWFKGCSLDSLVSDVGVTHELIHLMDENVRGDVNLEEIRQTFKEVLELV